MPHIHKLVYLGQMAGEYGGEYTVRWCRECGTVVEFLGQFTAEMIPERWVDEVKGSQYQYESGDLYRHVKKTPARVLGRSLKDLMNYPTSSKLAESLKLTK